ncbi:ArsR/SmtB family transcription factor [Marinactinospora rubrisoli]|uniref:ArsR/SmtB family transcription factor n=1 Tax=Marinactinospora rubrisoli TaxID=2715399 RepID=A0ABW2KBD9_9ACTN
MLRIHFTPEAPERVRALTGPDPMWEILLSLHMVQTRPALPLFEQWRYRVQSGMSREMWFLTELAPPAGYSPDFLTPMCGPDGLDRGIDTLLRTPGPRLRRELGQLGRQRPLSPAVRSLVHHENGLRPVAATLRRYFDLALAPEWDRIQNAAELGHRDGRLRHPTATRLPGALRPAARFRGPWLLEVAYPFQRDLDLRGRDLHLIPSVFCRRYPIALQDPGLPPVVVYPLSAASYAPGVYGPPRPQRRRALERMLGSTRTAVLEALLQGCTTGELARRLGISNASASEHAAVLRDAGLVTSHRDRNTVRHITTDLGMALFHGPDAPG